MNRALFFAAATALSISTAPALALIPLGVSAPPAYQFVAEKKKAKAKKKKSYRACYSRGIARGWSPGEASGWCRANGHTD